MLKRPLREPLVHFLALGALLFVVFHWRGGGGPGSNRIVITPGQIGSMVATFARTWQRPPTEQELKGLVDDYVREEMATREALAMGLDRDDTVIRRRLRQKIEFLVDESAAARPVTDSELQSWLQQHPEKFRIEPQVSFRQIYLSPDRRGDAAVRDARVLLARLSSASGEVSGEIGDSLMLPERVERSARSSVARQFGDGFAEEVLKVEPGRWAGPVRSGYGLHLVWIYARDEGRMPALDEVRPLLEREVMAERRRQLVDAMYDEMLSRYRVIVERRPTPPGAEK